MKVSEKSLELNVAAELLALLRNGWGLQKAYLRGLTQGRLLRLFFRGLLSVHSRYGLHARGVAKRPFTPRAPTALLPPLPPRLLPGGANQFPGGSCTR